MSALRAVVFDLYGTLIDVERSVFERRFPREIGVRARDWGTFLRQRLLVESFADDQQFVGAALETFAPERSTELLQPTVDLLRRELSSATLRPGAGRLLPFLRRRGLKLGLISNLASPYREPFERLGLAEHFDAVAFSCERGLTKPAPSLYLDLCSELGVDPSEALMVGDSRRNDVEAPRGLGLSSRRIGRTWSPDDDVSSLAGVGWLRFEADASPLLEPGRVVTLRSRRGEERVRISELEPVPEDEHGRYNLVFRAAVTSCRDDRGGPRIDQEDEQRPLYLKRYLLPESAHLEVFVHELLEAVDIACCDVGVLELGEPIFWSAEAPGQKLDPIPWTRELAYDVGRHGASAYLFSNGDLRPRNTFVVAHEDRLIMIDHEHCLFDRALDTSGLEDPFRPETIDGLSAEEIEARTKRRVLSPATMRRTHRAFFGHDAAPIVLEAYREGWIDLHRLARQRRDRLEDALRRRVYEAPYLVIGTRAYRRAMAGIDIRDLLARVDADVVATFDAPFAGPSRRAVLTVGPFRRGIVGT